MSKKSTLIAHPSNANELEIIKAFFKALKIKYEITKEDTSYNSDFVKKIEQGDKDLKEGKGRKVTLEELD